MPYFNKLAEGKISTLPPFTSRQTIRTQNANPVTVHIYSKSESSKYGKHELFQLKFWSIEINIFLNIIMMKKDNIRSILLVQQRMVNEIFKIYKKVIVKVLKKTIKVWSRRDSKLKGDCRGSQRHIRLIK
ncbi:hypothetical protein T03_4105, partial [Trichinella britovi]